MMLKRDYPEMYVDFGDHNSLATDLLHAVAKYYATANDPEVPAVELSFQQFEKILHGPLMNNVKGDITSV